MSDDQLHAQLIQRIQPKAIAKANTHSDLCRRGIHGVDIAEIDDHTLIAQVLQRRVREVKM